MPSQGIQHLSPRPFLKWAGGKNQLIQQYISHFPQNFQNYYEPFLGGGAVFFHLQGANLVLPDTPRLPVASAVSSLPRHSPATCRGRGRGGDMSRVSAHEEAAKASLDVSREPARRAGAISRDQQLRVQHAFLSDINPDLINTYIIVRDELDELINLLQTHQIRHSNEYYYQMRSNKVISDLGHKKLSPVERAARFIYLNKTCFNGLYRENSKGEFNVPIGRYKNPAICNEDLLHAVSSALKLAQIAVRPFESVLDFASSEHDFVYFDPPYHPLSQTSNFTAYSRYSFNENDQVRLRDIYAELALAGVKVMLSNSDCSLIRELYAPFNIHEISASRAINSDAKKRGKITELLITSY